MISLLSALASLAVESDHCETISVHGVSQGMPGFECMGYFRKLDIETNSELAKYNMTLRRPMYVMQRRQFSTLQKSQFSHNPRLPYAFLHFYEPYRMWVISKSLDGPPFCLVSNSVASTPLLVHKSWFYGGKTAVEGVKLKCRTPHRALHPLPPLLRNESTCQSNSQCNKGTCNPTFFECSSGLCRKQTCTCPGGWSGKFCGTNKAGSTPAPTTPPTAPVKAGPVAKEKVRCKGIVDCGCIYSQHRLFKCTAEVATMDLSKADIWQLTARAFEDLPVKTLILSFNNISVIEPGYLRGASQLRKLFLDHNALSTITLRAMENLTRVVELHLDHNLLATTMLLKRHMSVSLFRAMSSLEVLRLGYNRLTWLPQELLLGLHRLEQLHLEHNKISHIAKGALLNADHLQELHLSANRLTKVSVNDFPDSLIELFLDGNKIERFETSYERYATDALTNTRKFVQRAAMGSLQYMDLAKNPITSCLDPDIQRTLAAGKTRTKVCRHYTGSPSLSPTAAPSIAPTPGPTPLPTFPRTTECTFLHVHRGQCHFVFKLWHLSPLAGAIYRLYTKHQSPAAAAAASAECAKASRDLYFLFYRLYTNEWVFGQKLGRRPYTLQASGNLNNLLEFESLEWWAVDPQTQKARTLANVGVGCANHPTPAPTPTPTLAPTTGVPTKYPTQPPTNPTPMCTKVTTSSGVLGIVDQAGSQGVFSLYDPKMTSLKVGNRPAYQLLGRQPAETRYLYYMRNFRMWVISHMLASPPFIYGVQDSAKYPSGIRKTLWTRIEDGRKVRINLGCYTEAPTMAPTPTTMAPTQPALPTPMPALFVEGTIQFTGQMLYTFTPDKHTLLCRGIAALVGVPPAKVKINFWSNTTRNLEVNYKVFVDQGYCQRFGRAFCATGAENPIKGIITGKNFRRHVLDHLKQQGLRVDRLNTNTFKPYLTKDAYFDWDSWAHTASAIKPITHAKPNWPTPFPTHIPTKFPTAAPTKKGEKGTYTAYAKSQELRIVKHSHKLNLKTEAAKKAAEAEKQRLIRERIDEEEIGS